MNGCEWMCSLISPRSRVVCGSTCALVYCEPQGVRRSYSVVHVHPHPRTHAPTHTHIHILFVHVHTHPRTHAHTHTHIHILTDMHTYTHHFTCTHTYRHAHTRHLHLQIYSHTHTHTLLIRTHTPRHLYQGLYTTCPKYPYRYKKMITHPHPLHCPLPSRLSSRLPTGT